MRAAVKYFLATIKPKRTITIILSKQCNDTKAKQHNVMMSYWPTGLLVYQIKVMPTNYLAELS